MSKPMCGVCAGEGTVFGAPCICGGIGTQEAELQGFRERVAELEKALEEIEAIRWGNDGDCGTQRIIDKATKG